MSIEAIEGDVMDAGTTLPENRRSDSPSAVELGDTLTDWAVGGGIVTMALAPLAIPILALTAVALLPLLAPVVVIGVLAGVVALPVMLVRAVVRRVRAGRRAREAADRATAAHRAA
jgi:membrane protein implicated in regulation of membrane protease activity